MQGYFGFASLILLFCMVLVRTFVMNRMGIRAFVFGRTDKRDFIIPPIFLLFAYQLTAYTFGLPKLFGDNVNAFLFDSDPLRWLGVVVCVLGLLGLFASLVSFGRSFRVGIDDKAPDRLVTGGVFAIGRNPIYVSFGFVLGGLFLIFPSSAFLLVLLGGLWLFHRQVLIEETFLKKHYGEEYIQYSKKVRRYL